MHNGKIRVPDGMRKRSKRIDFSSDIERISFQNGMEFACSDLAENPILPTDEQIELVRFKSFGSGWNPSFRRILVEWQRLMFLAPEPEVSEEIKDLLKVAYCEDSTGIRHVQASVTFFEERIKEAYLRGKRSGEQKGVSAK